MNRAVWLGAVACAVAMAVACGEDEKAGGTGGNAGTGGGTGGTSGSGATGGTTGGTGGMGGQSGSGATGGSAGGGGAAGSDSGTPPHGRVLVSGTDFFSQTEIATVNLETGQLAGSVTVSDGDAVPAASGGKALVLERTASKVDVLSASGSIDKTIDVGKSAIGVSGTGSTNPVSVVLLDQSSADAGPDKGYVLLGNENRVAVISVGNASVEKTIDLSQYLASGDADGAVDMLGATLSGSKVYFVLGRIDRTTVTAPSYELACPAVKALVMAIDVATDTLVDLNGASAGEGIELALANPVDVALDPAQGRILVMSAGCFVATDGGSTRVSHGVEAVDLAQGTVKTLLTPANQDYLARLILLDSQTALVDSFDVNYVESWSSWSLASSTLGAALSGVPAGPVAENAAHLLGVNIVSGDAGTSVSVVRYDVGAKSSNDIVASPWTGTFTSTAGSTFVP